MSNTQFAFIERSQVPDREALQASIDKLGFDLKLHPEFTPFIDSGFSPCVLKGTPDVGFEISYGPADELIRLFPDLRKIAVAKDFVISMTWHSSMKDCAVAMIVSCALAQDYGAVISFEGNKPAAFEDLLEEARSIVRLAARERPPKAQPQQSSAGIRRQRKPWWRFW